MQDETLQLLKVHDYFRGLPEPVLAQVVAQARLANHAAGVVVHEAHEVPDTVNFVLRGRLKAVRISTQGVESFFRMFERGEQFGLMAGALAEPIPVRVITLEPTLLLTLDYEQAMELTLLLPELRKAWQRNYAGSLKKQFFGAAPQHTLKVLALVHERPGRREVTRRLIARLVEVGESIGLFSEADELSNLDGVRFRSLQEAGRRLEPDEIRQYAAGWLDVDRLVFDVDAHWEPERLARLLSVADRAIYFVPAAEGPAVASRLHALDLPGRGWRDKLSLAWLLDEEHPFAPDVPDLRRLVASDFKLDLSPPGKTWGPVRRHGIERLVHDLRGVRIGVALGGGAARGMSHLGVLKALEEAGIVVDMIAGTSAGAMTGTVYAAGLEANYAAERFAEDLCPSWIFNRLPRGSQWYLLYKFRRGHFDPMLRRYLGDWKLEQLPLPCLSVTVDLVSGTSVTRRQGDAVHAVLESINLPVLSVPICRDGQALVDGGLVNNIPADVLVAHGCNFVIAVSVTAKMEHEFCRIRPGVASVTGARPSIVQTLLRSLLVQNHNLNAIGVQPAEVVIEPDVTGFDLTEFKRAKELAAIGQATAEGRIPHIKKLLHRLDSGLFPFSPDG